MAGGATRNCGTNTEKDSVHSMPKLFSLLLCVLTLATHVVMAQVPDDLGNRFARATITENAKPLLMGTIFKDTADNLVVMGAPLIDVIARAHGMETYRIVDAPEWVRASHMYDIEAVPPPPELVESNEAAMLRSLLADRFKLQTRHETREVTMLVLDVDVEKQRDLAVKAAALKEQPGGVPTVPPPDANGDPARATAVLRMGIPVFTNMQTILRGLARSHGEPVHDLSGTQGAYLMATAILANGTPTAGIVSLGVRQAGSSLEDASLEQAGLIVERRTVSLDVLVVADIEHPVLDLVDR